MMLVVLFDKKNETYTRVENVIQISDACLSIKGRFTKVWLLVKNDGSETFKQKDYVIHRVDI